MKNVIILYDLIAREYWVNDQIKKEIINAGCKAELFSLNFEFYKALKYAKKEIIDLLIIPSCYSDADYERIVMPFKIIHPNIICICSHVEQIGFINKENELLCNDKCGKNNMLHMSWGSNFNNLLLKSGIRHELILETGNMRLQEIYKHNQFTREYLAKNHGLNANKKWIIYCDSATYFYYQMSSLSNNSKKKYSGVTFDAEAAEEYALTFIETNKILNSLSEDVFNRYEIIYRPHPGINSFEKNQYLNKRIHVIRDYSIYTWFDHVDYNIVFQSTSIFESDCMGVNSVILKPIPICLEVVGVNQYTTITNLLELENLILGSNAAISIKSNIYKDYMGELSTNMIHSFVHDVLTLNPEITKLLENPQCNVNMKKKYSSRIANYIVLIFNSIKLLKYLKIPKALEMNKYEHPVFSWKYKSN